MPKPLQDKRRWTLHEGQGEADWVEGPAFDHAQEVVPASSLDQALAERDRLAEVAGELAEALRDYLPYGNAHSTAQPAIRILARYEALRDG